MTILEAAAQLRARKVSSVELTEAALARIGASQPRLNAFITVTGERALARARILDEVLARGRDLGPLHGIPIAVKDLFFTRGERTTCGSKLFENRVTDCDAAVVEKLTAAGAVLVGKTGLHELAYGITSNNPWFGAIRNPWDTQRIPGGSSGGSGAAVAAGVVPAAMGSDTGGSIRIPSSYCGTVGLKPTFGRVSKYGAFPLAYSLDHMGPLTRSVRDAAVILQALAGHDPRDGSSSRRPVPHYLPATDTLLEGLRVGRPENFFFEGLDPQVEAAVNAMLRAAESAGARVVPLRVPDIAEINAVGLMIQLPEASAALEPYLARRDEISPEVLGRLDQGRLIAATDYVQAQRLRRRMQREFARLWEQVDCLFTPTTPITAPRIGENTVTLGGRPVEVRRATTSFMRTANLLGLPALSIPCGRDSRGLPIGLQIIGPPFDEQGVLRVGHALLPGEIDTAIYNQFRGQAT